MNSREHIHPDADALADVLASRLAAIIEQAVAERGRAVLALAGGGTPLPVYRRLAERSLPWPAVTVVPTDERWVDATHPARNDRALAGAFAAAPGIVILPLVPDSAAHAPALAAAEHALSTLTRFDAVLLGMGNDAHTASLFPGAVGLEAALDPAAADDAALIVPDPLPPEAPFPRITLSAARLLRSRHLLLAITGATKLATWEAARSGHASLQAPIGLFASQPGVVLDMHWSP
jgi:6-phosphogluconolactonase